MLCCTLGLVPQLIVNLEKVAAAPAQMPPAHRLHVAKLESMHRGLIYTQERDAQNWNTELIPDRGVSRHIIGEDADFDVFAQWTKTNSNFSMSPSVPVASTIYPTFTVNTNPIDLAGSVAVVRAVYLDILVQRSGIETSCHYRRRFGAVLGRVKPDVDACPKQLRPVSFVLREHGGGRTLLPPLPEPSVQLVRSLKSLHLKCGYGSNWLLWRENLTHNN